MKVRLFFWDEHSRILAYRTGNKSTDIETI